MYQHKMNVYQLLNFIWMVLKAQMQTVGTSRVVVSVFNVSLFSVSSRTGGTDVSTSSRSRHHMSHLQPWGWDSN